MPEKRFKTSLGIQLINQLIKELGLCENKFDLKTSWKTTSFMSQLDEEDAHDSFNPENQILI